MGFGHDTEAALESAVWLANTSSDPASFATLDALVGFFDRFGYTGERPGAGDVEPVRAIRAPLRLLFTAGRDGAVPLVNDILATASALPQLVRHGDVDWHIHATSDDRPLAERIMVESAMAMVDLIRADEVARLATCAMDDCVGIVLDLSRNRSRKYCSVACTNRAAAAAYRARQAT